MIPRKSSLSFKKTTSVSSKLVLFQQADIAQIMGIPPLCLRFAWTYPLSFF